MLNKKTICKNRHKALFLNIGYISGANRAENAFSRIKFMAGFFSLRFRAHIQRRYLINDNVE